MLKPKKLGLVGRLLLAGIALFGSSGCEPHYHNEYDDLSLGAKSAQYNSETAEQAFFWALMSDHFNTQADREDRRLVAEQNYNLKSLRNSDPERTAYINGLIERAKVNDPNYSSNPELSVRRQRLKEREMLIEKAKVNDPNYSSNPELSVRRQRLKERGF